MIDHLSAYSRSQ